MHSHYTYVYLFSPETNPTVAFTGEMATSLNPPEIDGPPPKENSDLPQTSKKWEYTQIPIDVLLLTVKDCEFSYCHSILKESFKSYHDKLGGVYFGNVGDGGMKVKIALIRCNMGSGVPSGSTVVVKNAVDVLGPKVVVSVGFCGGLNRKVVNLGDVVVSAKLITYTSIKNLEDAIQDRGYRVPPSERILKLITGIDDGWKVPLKDPKELRVKVHRNGVFLSGPELVDNSERRKELIARYPEAIAIEMEGEGTSLVNSFTLKARVYITLKEK